MKYKVGDKVKIVDERVAEMNSAGEMDMYLGTIMTIDRVEGEQNSLYATYYMKEDNNEWCWNYRMIERKVGIKTYQILEKIDNNYKKVKGEKYRLIKSSNNLKSISVGDTAYIGKTWGGEYGLLNNKNNLLIADLTGFEEWEKVADRPVSFMEAVESGKKIKVEHDFIDDDIGYLKENYTFLGDMLWELGESLSTDGVQDVIMNGKFYIED